VLALILVVPAAASVPGHFRGIDESGDHSARTWLATLAAALPPNAVIVSWWSFSTTLWYGQYVEGWRPDVTIVDDRTILDQNLGSAQQVVDSYLGTRPVFIIRVPNDYATFKARYVTSVLPGVTGQQILEVTALRAAANV
jgi:hypothetical protein